MIRVVQRDGVDRVDLLQSASGPDQLLIRLREEAMAKAPTCAKREHRRVWLDDAGHCVMLEDFRVMERA